MKLNQKPNLLIFAEKALMKQAEEKVFSQGLFGSSVEFATFKADDRAPDAQYFRMKGQVFLMSDMEDEDNLKKLIDAETKMLEFVMASDVKVALLEHGSTPKKVKNKIDMVWEFSLPQVGSTVFGYNETIRDGKCASDGLEMVFDTRPIRSKRVAFDPKHIIPIELITKDGNFSNPRWENAEYEYFFIITGKPLTFTHTDPKVKFSIRQMMMENLEEVSDKAQIGTAITRKWSRNDYGEIRVFALRRSLKVSQRLWNAWHDLKKFIWRKK